MRSEPEKRDAYAAKLSHLTMRNPYKQCIAKYISKLRRVENNDGNFWIYVNEIENAMHLDIANNQTDIDMIFGVGAQGTGSKQNAVAMYKLGYDVARVRYKNLGEDAHEWASSFMQPMFRSQLSTDEEIRECHRNYQDLDFRYPFGMDAIFDTPAPQLFWDFFRTYINAKFLLAVQNSTEWATGRLAHQGSSPAIIYRPCGLRTRDFDVESNAKLFEAHNDFIRCIVPSYRIVEVCNACNTTTWGHFKKLLGLNLTEFGFQSDEVVPRYDDFKIDLLVNDFNRVVTPLFKEDIF